MTQMTARYAGRCAESGAPIRPGDTIEYDRESRRTVLVSALRRQASRYSRTDVAIARQSATGGLGGAVMAAGGGVAAIGLPAGAAAAPGAQVQ